jgi:hypothetical protein
LVITSISSSRDRNSSSDSPFAMITPKDVTHQAFL